MRSLWALLAVTGACNAPEDKPELSTTAGSLTSFVTTQKAGTLPGGLDVLPTGMAGYGIPIEVPAWRGGVQPSLALRYAGDAGNGWLGVGWTLEGLSVLSRCSKTFAMDGEPGSVTGWNDALCLDGARLVAIDGTDLFTTTAYRTNPDAMARVTVTGRDTQGAPTGFRVELKNGRIRQYGGSSAYRVEAMPRITNTDGSLAGYNSARTLSWLMASEADRSGNQYTVSYTKLAAGGLPDQVEYVPSRIDYGTRRIEFQFCGDETDLTCVGSPMRPDPLERWTGGIQTWITRRLRAVTISAPTEAGGTPTAVVRSYQLKYQQSSATRRSLLSEVALCDGAGVCLEPTRFTYTGVAPSFSTDPGIASPGFTNYTAAAGQMHVLDLDGDGRDDVIYVKSSDGYWYARFGTSAAPWLSGEVRQANVPRCDSCPARAVDVNRDGKTDLMVELVEPAPNGIGSTVTARFYLSNGTALGPADPTYDISIPQPTQPFNPDEDYKVNRLDPMITFADMNGDGMIDVFFRSNRTPTQFGDIVSYRGKRGGGWTSHATFAWPSTSSETDHWQLVDLDGEGRAELLYHHTAGTYGPKRVGTRKVSSTLELVTETPASNLTADSCHVFVDLNGDGQPDLANVRSGVVVRMNLGNYRFGPPVSVLPASTDPNLAFDGVLCDPFSNSFDELHTDRGVRVADVDGDGKEDLVIFYRTNGRTNVHWYRAAELVASGSMTPIVIGSSLPVPVRQDGNLGGSAAAMLADFNGDGRVDLFQSGPFNGETRAQVAVQVGETPDLLKRATNGVARADEVDYAYLATSAAYTRELCTNIGGHPTRCHPRPGVAVVRTKVDDGTGLRATFEYTYDARQLDLMGSGDLGFAIRTIKDVRPPPDAGDPNRTKNPTTRIFTSGYRSGDPDGMGYYLHQSSPTSVETSVFDPVENRWQFTRAVSTNDTRMSFDSKTRLIWPRSQRSEALSGTTPSIQSADSSKGVRTTVIEIDGYGNETSRVTEAGDGVGAVTTSAKAELSYTQDNPTIWLIGLPTHIKETSTSFNTHAVQTQSSVRNTAFRYDATTGLLSRTVIEPSSPTALDSGDPSTWSDTRIIARDSFGQPTQTATYRKPLSGFTDTGGLVRTSKTTYDADGVHVTSTTPALELAVPGQLTTSRVVDPGRGVVLSETDANGLVTQHQYDRLGRPRATQAPNGTSTETSYAWDGPAKRLVMTATGNDGSASVTYTDPLGRERTRETKNFSGTMSRVVTTYDHSSRVFSVTEPYVTGTPNEVRTTYDGLGRVVSTCLHVAGSATPSSCERMRYRLQFARPDVVEATDPSGRRTETERDAAGRVVATTIYTSVRPGSCDAADNQTPARTTFAFGPFDLLASSKDAAGNLVALGYDVRGRRTRLDDADTGARTFTYDGFGDLREERDADGRVTRWDYDPIGRRIQRSSTPIDPDGIARWTYDTASGAGKGKPSSSSNGEVTRTFAYGGPGGALSHASISYAGGATYTVMLSYDGFGRVKDTMYPEVPGRGTFATRNIYSAATGYLSEIQIVEGPNGGSTLWKATSADAANRVTREEVNAGRVNTNFTYDPTSRRATGILTRIASSNEIIQSSEFSYCKNGNVASRRDFLQNQTESFEYDDANRLVLARLQNGTTRTWSYDELGNLKQTNDPGLSSCAWNYGEGTPGPHAVTSLQCGSTKYPFVYDANGNMTAAPAIPSVAQARTVTFGPQKASTISASGAAYRMIYDADGVRVAKQQTVGGSTRTEYVDGLFERTINPDGSIDHAFLVSALGKAIGQYTWHWTGPAGTHDWRFIHHDVLGSPELTSNMAGTGVAERLSFDAWGKRRSPTWTNTTSPAAPSNLKLGFTGHDHDDEVGVIDMGGRIYDPTFKRFMSADPFVQAPFHGLGYNRYSYVFNNPLKYTDPSGYRASLSSPNRFNGGVVSVTRPYEQGWGLLEGTFGIAMTELGQGWLSDIGIAFLLGAASGLVNGGETRDEMLSRVETQIANAVGMGATDLDPSVAGLIVSKYRPTLGGHGPMLADAPAPPGSPSDRWIEPATVSDVQTACYHYQCHYSGRPSRIGRPISNNEVLTIVAVAALAGTGLLAASLSTELGFVGAAARAGEVSETEAQWNYLIARSQTLSSAAASAARAKRILKVASAVYGLYTGYLSGRRDAQLPGNATTNATMGAVQSSYAGFLAGGSLAASTGGGGIITSGLRQGGISAVAYVVGYTLTRLATH